VEGLGEQKQALQTVGHDQTDDGPARSRTPPPSPAGPPAPVDDGTEQRCHHGERRHGQQQIEQQFSSLMKGLGREDVLADPRFAGLASRGRNEPRCRDHRGRALAADSAKKTGNGA